MAAGTAAAGRGATRPLGTPRIALLTSYWLALGFLWLPLGSTVLPRLILDTVGDSHKGAGVAILEGTVDTWFMWQTAMDQAIAAGARRPHNLIEVRYGLPSGPHYYGPHNYVPR